MSSRFSGATLALVAIILASCRYEPAASSSVRGGEKSPARLLRVCADPNNLPFSNQRLEGFENELAKLIASEMNAAVTYEWWAQRRGFVRNTLRAGKCDVILGVPSSFELALATRPYYRSSYVFVTRADRKLDITSLDDERLKKLRVGVQLVGDDGATTPPALALARRGAIDNVVGYTVFGDYSKPNPPARIIEAVASGEIDVALAWGPLAGYFAPRQNTQLRIEKVTPEIDLPFTPMVFDISLGVRRNDVALKEELEQILARRKNDIDALLARYGVPRIDAGRGRAS